MAEEQVIFSNISATTAAFGLGGGLYAFDATATWGGGSATLQRLGPDGTTYITALTALSANGTSAATWLPAGTYKIAIVTATVVYASVTRIQNQE